jgi:hypothetical protein
MQHSAGLNLNRHMIDHSICATARQSHDNHLKANLFSIVSSPAKDRQPAVLYLQPQRSAAITPIQTLSIQTAGQLSLQLLSVRWDPHTLCG